MQNQKGFTLIELMVVVSIIGILAAIAIPQFGAYSTRAKISEGYSLVRPIMKDIVEYYDHKGILPYDNLACGLPPAELIKGKYVQGIKVEEGTIFIKFDKNQLQNTETLLKGPDNDSLIIYPIINNHEPTPSIIWELKK